MAIWNERIRSKRLEKGITLSQVADALGVTEATAQRYESGNIKSVPYEHMCVYGNILGCSPAYLMGWDNETIEAKYNTLSSSHSEHIGKYIDYLFLVERQLISDNNSDEYIDFIISEIASSLNDTGKREALKRVTELTQIPWYTNEIELSAAHERTDIKITNEMRKHDDDIMDNDDF